MSEDNIVFFLMPDGSKVSNDPRWLMDQDKSVHEIAIEGVPNTGYATPHWEDEELTKGQQDMTNSMGPTVTGKTVQHEDRNAAKEGGFDENNPEFTEEPIDVNEKVLEARKAREEQRKAAYEAAVAAGDDVGNPDEPYSEWTVPALKAEIKRRRAMGREIDLKGKSKKSEVAAALEDDDKLQDQQTGSSASMTG